MGIYDRDYYRKEGPGYLGSIAMRGRMCRWLLGINVAVYFLQLLFQQPFTDAFLLSPERVLHGEVWRLITYAFLHDTRFWEHIFFNMWMLWLYGGHVEDLYGPWEFLAFYLTAAFFGGAAFFVQAVLGWNMTIVNTCLGASGAVMAVLVLCALRFPMLTILLFFVLPVPIWLMALLFVAQDVFGFLSGGHGIAFSVHLAGAAFAFVYFKMQTRITSLWPRGGMPRFRRRPRLRLVREDDDLPLPLSTGVPDLPGDDLESRVDAVLDKVARHGQQSLSDSEKQILLRASEIYKKRRS